MEHKYVYITREEIEERRAQINAIEGLAEIQAAIDAGENIGKIDALRAKYPRAAVYMEAERWTATDNPVKVRLGSRSIDKILNGEDPEKVIAYMSNGLDAFYLAQEA